MWDKFFDEETSEKIEGLKRAIGDCYFRIATHPDNEEYRQQQLEMANKYGKQLQDVIESFLRNIKTAND